MADTPSFDDLEIIGRAEQIVNRPDLQVNEGDVSEMLIKAAAAMADKCLQESARLFRATYVDGARGDELTQLANDHWGLARFDAVLATGEVQFSRPSATAGAGTIPTGTVIATEPDVNGLSYRFLTDAPVAFGAADTGPLTITVTAEVTGPDSNVAAGAVVRVIDNLFDGTITVTNAVVMTGGSVEETDSELRERLREFPSTLRRGTLSALEFGAKQVASVKSATAVESAVSGTVQVYIADASGNASAQMISDVTAELNDWRCAGTAVTVLAGAPLLVDIDYSILVRAGTDILALGPVIQAAITGAMDTLKIGEALYVSLLHAAVQNVDPVNILEVIINTPATGIAPLANQLIRTGTVTQTPL